eukprot:3645571-Prymnesium_polylepis.1
MSLAEFFTFTLQAVMHGTENAADGAGGHALVEGQLAQWDSAGGGALDRTEFKKLAKRLAYADGNPTIVDAAD